jgi:hypothetical protein
MRHLPLLLAVVIAFFVAGCSAPAPAPIKVELTHQTIDYLADVKPILDKRCVTCHSCYNSPCQAKFSSFEGIDRGGSKALVYDAIRLNSIDPTRLFVDAQNTQQWRTKGFFSLTESLDTNASFNDSVMIHMLSDKMEHPEIIGEYAPEKDELICPRNSEEMGTYLEEKPNHGMPYGFPALKRKEYNILAQWLRQGAKGPNARQQQMITAPSAAAAKEITKWEAFLNAPDAKHAMTARYLYEHYFLAHLNFKAAPTEFYELVRSKTAAPQAVELIPTLRPFDDPKTEVFYYRFRRIHSTIVHKTHMVVELDDAELARMNELFIRPEWTERPHRIGYKTKMSANPFVTFFQIPVRSRYQFLLEHNNYIVMTFIRGPVCRGQMALNVIHDHFWVMFQDPDFELSIQQPGFLLRQADNLSMPIETVNKSVLETFSDAYLEKYKAYYKAKEALYDRTYPQGLGLEGIWRGNGAKDTPLLTVYRHFDSASVHRGVIGELPRTMWVIDYPQFERIYYALVAGYDVYGNLSHQTNIRRYMDFLRKEGEINFLSYMPPKQRLEMSKSWYIGDKEVQKLKNTGISRGTQVVYKTAYPKSEFIEQVVNGHILKSTGIGFDPINYFSEGEVPPKMPTVFNTIEDIRNGARSLTAPGSGFIRQIVDHGANLIHMRLILPDEKDRVYTLVINRWHDNVNSLFDEGDRLDSSKDTLDIIPGSVGSYPNAFAVVHYRDLPDFFDMIANLEKNEHYREKFRKYFISRADERFWETYDWFQNSLNSADPLQAGLYDLNRYYRKAW